MGIGEELLCLLLDELHFFLGLVRVVRVEFYLQTQPLIVVVHPVFGFGSACIFVKQQQLGHHVGVVRYGIGRVFVGIERAVHVLYDVENGVVAFGKLIGLGNAA